MGSSIGTSGRELRAQNVAICNQRESAWRYGAVGMGARRSNVDALQSDLRRDFADVDMRAIAVIATVIGVLMANRYLGSLHDTRWVSSVLDAVGLDRQAAWWRSITDGFRHQDFNRKVYFAVFRIVVYLVPALIVGRKVLGMSMADLGWRITRRHAGIYAGLFAAMLPLVVLASRLDSFQATYPFYSPNFWESVWPWFVVWELLYFLHFIALELFFRGFAIHGLASTFGTMAVFISVIPYVMIHFSKPFPEAVGSIVAGVVLGFLSLRSGSAFWGGVLHFGVALSMDLLTY